MTNVSAKLLLIDDDAELSGMLSEYLALQGFEVKTAASGESGISLLGSFKPDLIVLDVMLPGMSGFEVLETVRRTHETPIIMLTARGDEPDRIHGLMRGADDYLGKPFSSLELAVRIQAILKRSTSQTTAGQPTELSAGPVRLDLSRRAVDVRGVAVDVTAAELRVLEQLLQHPGEVLSRSALTEKALDRALEPYDRSIDTLISKLRKKLAAAGVAKECIRALRGHGYVLDMDVLNELG